MEGQFRTWLSFLHWTKQEPHAEKIPSLRNLYGDNMKEMDQSKRMEKKRRVLSLSPLSKPVFSLLIFLDTSSDVIPPSSNSYKPYRFSLQAISMFHHTLHNINSYVYIYLLFSAFSGKKTKPQTNTRPPKQNKQSTLNKSTNSKTPKLSQLFYYLDNIKIANLILTE